MNAAEHSVHPTDGSLRVFRQFAWLEVGSGKVALSRPTHQRVTHTVETVELLMRNSFNKMQHDIETRLPTIHVPTLIIHGDFDPIPSKSSEYLQEQILESQIVIIIEAGHFPFIEQPEQFVATLRTFLGN